MMTDEQVKSATESMMWTIAMFQKGFETILKENKGMEHDDVLKLTEIWWNGVMLMVHNSQDETEDENIRELKEYRRRFRETRGED